jgi:hypothetical protein
MPEILTESFCERCGTRYTFESAAPKQKRLGRFKVLSQGFKNFVMSDDTSLDEAFAAARNDEEREAVTQQLDAFHKTFNFCMNCRQYTCSNCWNEAEGRCLTCSPHLGHEVLPAAFPTLETNGNGAGVDNGPRLDGLAWPTLDLPPEPEAPSATADLAWPETIEASDTPAPAPTMRVDGLPDWASLATEEGPSVSVPAEPEAPAEPPDLESLLAHPALAPAEAQSTEAPEPEAAEAPEAVAPEAAQPVEAEAPESTAPAVDDRLAAAAAQTADLLARFRPGQSIDAALEEYEASVAAQDAETAAAEEPDAVAEPVAEPVAEAAAPTPAEAGPETAPEPVAAIHETPLETEPATPLDEVLAEIPPLESEVAGAIVETEPEPARPEPAIAELAEPEAAQAEPEPAQPELEPTQPEPVAAQTSEPETATPSEPAAPAAPADDRVEVPVWRIVAPDTPVPPADRQPVETNLPTAASAEPHWPQTPAWPGQESQIDVSFLAARLSRKPSNDALWAASSRDVVAPLPQQPAPPAVQTCVSCGLSLSATARFCRRCGSRQGG